MAARRQSRATTLPLSTPLPPMPRRPPSRHQRVLQVMNQRYQPLLQHQSRWQMRLLAAVRSMLPRRTSIKPTLQQVTPPPLLLRRPKQHRRQHLIQPLRHSMQHRLRSNRSQRPPRPKRHRLPQRTTRILSKQHHPLRQLPRSSSNKKHKTLLAIPIQEKIPRQTTTQQRQLRPCWKRSTTRAIEQCRRHRHRSCGRRSSHLRFATRRRRVSHDNSPRVRSRPRLPARHSSTRATTSWIAMARLNYDRRLRSCSSQYSTRRNAATLLLPLPLPPSRRL